LFFAKCRPALAGKTLSSYCPPGAWWMRICFLPRPRSWASLANVLWWIRAPCCYGPKIELRSNRASRESGARRRERGQRSFVACYAPRTCHLRVRRGGSASG